MNLNLTFTNICSPTYRYKEHKPDLTLLQVKTDYLKLDLWEISSLLKLVRRLITALIKSSVLPSDITIKLPPHVQQSTMDSFAVILEQPTAGRAELGNHTQCVANIDNDISTLI